MQAQHTRFAPPSLGLEGRDLSQAFASHFERERGAVFVHNFEL